MKFLVFVLLALSWGSISLAGVEAFVGDAGEKLFVESAPKLGKDTFLVKFEGVESKWAGKVIQTTKEAFSGGYTYRFEYEYELTGGVQKKTYLLLRLKGGSMELMTQEKSPDMHIYFSRDKELTSKSQEINLGKEFSKAKYKPEVD